ncbi:MAG: universal stress protein [Pseudolysinimonas sp.]
MERVLIGIDNEAPSQVAVDWVIRRSRSVDVRVRLVTAFDMLLDDAAKDQARLDETRRRISEAAPEVVIETELVDHSIWSALVEASRDADLLVIGFHRGRPIRSALSGDLPGRLAALSKCPIVIVPDDWCARDGEIVVGIADDPFESDSALVFAAREADACGRRLNLVHAWQHPTSPVRGIAPISVLPLAAAQILHRRVLSTAGDLVHRVAPSLVPHESLVERPAGESLLDHLGDAELVVVGAHPPQLSDLLLGTVVKQLMTHSATPVCIVPRVPVEVPA